MWRESQGLRIIQVQDADGQCLGGRTQPPAYNTETNYPVLYLLHGIGGDETEWKRFATPDVMFDNLMADKKVVPMFVVMPNGRAEKDDQAECNVFAAAPAFTKFERDCSTTSFRRSDPSTR